MNFRKVFIVSLLVFLFAVKSGYSATTVVKPWTKQWGNSNENYGYGVAVDSSGNIFVTGKTYGGIDGNPYLGWYDIFLTKYDSSGAKQWTKQWGTTDWDSGQSVAIDSSGNIYVTGYTHGGLDGNINAGDEDIFLTKYDSSGVKQWTKQWGTESSDDGFDVAIDSLGNIYVTGYTYGGLDGNTLVGWYDIFLTKYDSSGVKQWTKQWGTTNHDSGLGISVDSSDNVYVTGYTGGGFDDNTNAGWYDIFLIKCDSSGAKQWTKQWGTSDYDIGNSVAIDSSGNIYVTGSTGGGLDGNINAGWDDIFLTKYDSSGSKQWTKQWGTTSIDSGRSVAIDSTGNLYVIGRTYGGLDGNINAGEDDIFLTKYDSSGVKQWTKQWGTKYRDSGESITVDSSENIYVTGSTNGNLDGNINKGKFDIFLSKWFLTNIPELSWTGETGYVSDGLDPETGDNNTDFVYRVKYTDADNDAPKTGYPKVHILKNGTDISGSPFTMSYISGNYNTGAIYSYSKKLSGGIDYTYYFRAEDIYGANNTTSSINAPDVTCIIIGIITENGNPFVGITVNLSGDSTASTITDVSGNYTFVNLDAGATYIIIPTKTNYTFTPVERNYIDLNSDKTNAHFTGTFNQWTISGTITDGRKPLNKVVLSITQDGVFQYSIRTNNTGMYSFNNLNAGCTYIVTPSLKKYSFIPTDVTYAALNQNKTQNFLGKKNYSNNLGNAFTFPNPAKGVKDGDTIVFSELTQGCKIQIFTIKGDLIIEIFPDRAEHYWDIKNKNKKLISSGIYLYVITDENGNEKTGKIAIIK